MTSPNILKNTPHHQLIVTIILSLNSSVFHDLESRIFVSHVEIRIPLKNIQYIYMSQTSVKWVPKIITQTRGSVPRDSIFPPCSSLDALSGYLSVKKKKTPALFSSNRTNNRQKAKTKTKQLIKATITAEQIICNLTPKFFFSSSFYLYKNAHPNITLPHTGPVV